MNKMATRSDYLAMPYGRHVVPEPDGTYRAEIIEFPGCIAAGDTAAEALARLEDVAHSWLAATLERQQRVPEPIESAAFSGKLVLRLARSLHKQAAHAAARDGVSLNSFIADCVAQRVAVGGVRCVSGCGTGESASGCEKASQNGHRRSGGQPCAEDKKELAF